MNRKKFCVILSVILILIFIFIILMFFNKNNNNIEKVIEIKNNPLLNSKRLNKNPYYIKVIRNHNIVLVYGLEDDGNYSSLVKNFTVSVGRNGSTPLGTFKTSDKYEWRYLYGDVWGQYATRIVDHILFHSVPYEKKSKDSLEYEEYNKLGEEASLGCVRMRIKDLKWIYDNCPSGTTVKIYDGSIPKGINKKVYKKIDDENPNRGWDPTDPDENNPWNK